jgi:hypothetical protein
MLYIAFVKNKPRWQLGDVDLTAKSRQWWNEGQKPGTRSTSRSIRPSTWRTSSGARG